jgi:hypothetical protein
MRAISSLIYRRIGKHLAQRYNPANSFVEVQLNLFWLKYVSYAFLAGAVFFYFVMRLNKLALSIQAKASLFASCIVLACLCWYTQEQNAQLHSPRRLIIGNVIQMSEDRHRGGLIHDEFQVQLKGGSKSPRFSADAVTLSKVEQPIHVGDLLGVLYRTWDDVPLTIDELQGQKVGWHYRRIDDSGSYIFAVLVFGSVMLAGALIASHKSRRDANSAQTE